MAVLKSLITFATAKDKVWNMDAASLNGEKVLLARDILSINNLALLNEVKRRLSGLFDFSVARKTKVTDNTDAVLDAVCGQWIDSRDADAMVQDIYASRVNKDDSELLKILGE